MTVTQMKCAGFRWVAAALLMTPVVAVAGLVVEDARVRAMPPGQSVAALYFEVINHTDQPCTLVAVTTPVADRTELHRTEEKDGMARMRHQEALEIAPHGSLQLAPGADHVMLFDVVERLESGMKVEAELDFGTCGTHVVSAEVRDMTGSSRSPAGTGNGHHHHHHH